MMLQATESLSSSAIPILPPRGAALLLLGFERLLTALVVFVFGLAFFVVLAFVVRFFATVTFFRGVTFFLAGMLILLSNI
jgi:hypothetical protein